MVENYAAQSELTGAEFRVPSPALHPFLNGKV